MSKFLNIISLIISVIALIYICLVYFGIIRYIKLHINEPEYYIQKYSILPKADNNRIIVSFTADEKNLGNLKPFINSILDQSVRIDDIALTIPYKDKNKVPENLEKILSVYGINKNYGDATKLVPAVLREPEATTKIIIVEPTMVYGQDFISDMVDESNKFPEKIINDKKGGFLIKPEFFNNEIADFVGSCKDCCKKEIMNISCPCTYKNLIYIVP